MKERALTDDQNVVAAKIMTAISDHAPDDAFAAFASIMAATINHQSGDLREALARGEMWGQRFVDLLVQGRKGNFATAGDPEPIDLRFLL